jgi:hypothetical protein
MPMNQSSPGGIVLIVPPVAKPCEPLLGAYSLARQLRLHGFSCTMIDGNLDWFGHQLRLPESIGMQGTAMGAAEPVEVSDKRSQRALRHLGRGNPLKDFKTFENRDRYGQAVEHLQAALRFSCGPFSDEEPGLADYRVQGLRPVCRRDLIDYGNRSDTVFDDYLHKGLLARIADMGPRIVGISLTFLHQVFAAIRIAKAVKERHPQIRLILGGAMVDCWQNADFRLPPFDVFDQVISATPSAWQKWQEVLGSSLPDPKGHGFFIDPEDLPEEGFFAPQRIVPLAFGMGCAWGRCTFCPDYLKHSYRPSTLSPWMDTLEGMVKDNASLVLHITDSCVPPRLLDEVSRVIAERRWPVRWYAFVRLGKAMLKPERLERWALGGCGLLQFGMESACPELLKKMQKGISVPVAAEILRKSAEAGIRNYVYLLFGFPGETLAQQEQTLDFVTRHQNHIHYLNNAVFSLPKNSPMAADPHLFGIRELRPMAGEDSDLSLYLDFLDDFGSARMRARQFLQERFLTESAVRRFIHALPPVFKSNHAILARW